MLSVILKCVCVCVFIVPDMFHDSIIYSYTSALSDSSTEEIMR